MTFDSGAARIFLPLHGWDDFCPWQGAFYCLCAHPLRLAGVFRHLASLESLVPPSRLRMRSLQWHLLTLWSHKSDHPSLPVPLSRAMRWISLRGWCSTVFSTGVFIQVSGSESAPYSDASRSGWTHASSIVLVSTVRLGQEMLFHNYLLELRAMFLALPSIPVGVTVLSVTAMCDDSMVLASVDMRAGLCPASSAS